MMMMMMMVMMMMTMTMMMMMIAKTMRIIMMMRMTMMMTTLNSKDNDEEDCLPRTASQDTPLPPRKVEMLIGVSAGKCCYDNANMQTSHYFMWYDKQQSSNHTTALGILAVGVVVVVIVVVVIVVVVVIPLCFLSYRRD